MAGTKRKAVAVLGRAESLEQAESLLQADDYEGAAAAAESALGDPSMLSRAAVVQGKALVAPLVRKIGKNSGEDDPRQGAFDQPMRLFELALRLDPANAEAKSEIEYLQGLSGVVQLLPREAPPPNHSDPFDVIVVGAGASGIGVALMLVRTFGLDPQRVLLLERGEGVGESFRQWPKEMRFISPSFNSQGWTGSFDLNSVAYGTSPAFTLQAEHPTGEQYAFYLNELAMAAGLRVQPNTEVTAIKPRKIGGGFEVETRPWVSSSASSGEEEEEEEEKAKSPAGGSTAADGANNAVLKSRYVIWAAGEFQYPRNEESGPLFPGSEHCLHNSSVGSWAELPGDDFVVIGGYESGMDAAFNISSCGKRCTVVSSTAYWRVTTDDPSTELAPYTAERVREACDHAPIPPRLMAPLRVFKVEPNTGEGGAQEDGGEEDKEGKAGGFLVHARWGARVEHPGGQHRAPIPEKLDLYDAWQAAEAEEMQTDGQEEEQTATAAAEAAAGAAAAEVGSAPAEDDEEQQEEEQLEEEEEEEEEEIGEEGTEVTLHTPQAPLLCAGFEGSVALGVARDLFDWGDGDQAEGDQAKGGEGCAAGSPRLDEKTDESTKTPGLFLVGPAVRHGELSFCFVYKFRQRFGVVADAIARGLGRDTAEKVKACRNMNMFLDDFNCCKGACGETC